MRHRHRHGLLLLLLPLLAKRLGWPPLVVDILFWMLNVLLSLGLFAAALLTTSRYSRASARAHKALAWLASHPDVRDAEARGHAVALLRVPNIMKRVRMGFIMLGNLSYQAINDDGGLAQVIDVNEARQKLGESLHYVVAVERVLAGENSAEVVFGKPLQ